MPTYNVLIRDIDRKILDYHQGERSFSDDIQGASVIEYEASEAPDIEGVISEGGEYTAPTAPYLVLEWDPTSAGAASEDDGVWEFTSNGGNRVYLNVSLYDRVSAKLLGTDNSSIFTVRVNGSLSPDGSFTKVTLAEGTAQIYFTPPSSIKGDMLISVIGVNNSYVGDPIRIRVL